MVYMYILYIIYIYMYNNYIYTYSVDTCSLSLLQSHDENFVILNIIHVQIHSFFSPKYTCTMYSDLHIHTCTCMCVSVIIFFRLVCRSKGYLITIAICLNCYPLPPGIIVTIRTSDSPWQELKRCYNYTVHVHVCVHVCMP